MGIPAKWTVESVSRSNLRLIMEPVSPAKFNCDGVIFRFALDILPDQSRRKIIKGVKFWYLLLYIFDPRIHALMRKYIIAFDNAMKSFLPGLKWKIHPDNLRLRCDSFLQINIL
jgi:hypothetical protein